MGFLGGEERRDDLHTFTVPFEEARIVASTGRDSVTKNAEGKAVATLTL